MGIKKAKTKELRRVTLSDLGVQASNPHQEIERVYVPEKSKQTQLIDGTPKEAAAKLVEKLKFEARVL
jgi:electron transfer flavoprotein beta subunit